MPTHGYTTTRQPPSFLDHVLAHPFELGLSLWAMLGGASAIFGAFNDERTVSQSLDQLPIVLAGVVGVLLLIGGACIVKGLFDNSDDLRIGWRWEQAGLAMTGFAWAAYGVAISSLSPSSFLSISLCVAVFLMSVLRIAATVISQRTMRKVTK